MRRRVILGAMFALGCAEFGMSQAAATASQALEKNRVAQHLPAAQSAGEQRFKQNCSRCHNAPEELPRRITGTVMMHMRVRANLSAADEREILRYLAP